ncbi:DUF7269 family protein [Halarchaeum sp. P4]|uniref:DUF7269 family protein n=1 Tax=Halarchaeum sp. P4 TaxID=3421639 RepID=UPI003EBD3C8A
MSLSRRLALSLGVASSVVGLLLLAAPSLASAVTLSGGLGTATVALVGVVTLLIAAGSLFADAVRPSAEATLASDDPEFPRPEHRPAYASPGAAFTRRLAEVTWTDRREAEPATRLALRDDLRDLAVDVLSRRDGVTPDEAAAHLADGSWTDDPLAAAFFTDDVVPSLSLRQRLRGLRGSEPPFARRARHAVAALASHAGDADVSAVAAEGDDAAERVATTRRYWSSAESGSTRTTRSDRFRPVTAAALLAGGLGIVTLRPGLLLLALFGVTVAGYTRATTPPSVAVDVSRSLADATPAPEDPVDVTVTVENTGGRTLTDLRIVDGVPAGLTVAEGSPRATTALRPGKRITFTYTVTAAPGRHEFDPTLLVARDASGVHRRESVVDAPSTLTCRPDDSQVSLPDRVRTTVHAGRTASTHAGSGVEFHSVREYRRGDPRSRIDWKRRAKTGDLTTVDFREPRRADVLVAVDARRKAYVASATEAASPAVRRSLDAARGVVDECAAASIPVGLTALSPRACWLAPATGDAHHRRLRAALLGDAAFSWEPPTDVYDVDRGLETLERRLRPGTRVVLVTPLCDDDAEQIARRLAAAGRDVTVVSPDPTLAAGTNADCARGYAALARRRRVGTLRSQGLSVLDWRSDERRGEEVRRDL